VPLFFLGARSPTTRVYTLVAAPAVAAVGTTTVAPKASASCGKFLKKCD
jgi:hypothetical protein